MVLLDFFIFCSIDNERTVFSWGGGKAALLLSRESNKENGLSDMILICSDYEQITGTCCRAY